MAKFRVDKMSALVLIFITVSLGVLGQLSLKRGMTNVGTINIGDLFTPRLLSIITEKFVIAGIFLYFLASVLWLVVLSQEDLSFAYPLIGLGYILTAILAKFFFNENLTLFRIIGVLLIAAGAYFIVLKI